MRRRRLGVMAATWVMMLLLSACSGGDSEPDADPSATAADPAATAPAETSVQEPEPSPSEATGVEPASGEEVTFNGVRLRVPETYEVFDTFSSGMSASDTQDSLRGVSALSSNSIGRAQPLEVALDDFLANNQFQQRPTTRDPVIVDGVEMFHVAGPIDSVAWLEGYGVTTEDYTYFFEFTFPEASTSAEERRRVVDSVLATVDFTD